MELQENPTSHQCCIDSAPVLCCSSCSTPGICTFSRVADAPTESVTHWSPALWKNNCCVIRGPSKWPAIGTEFNARIGRSRFR